MRTGIRAFSSFPARPLLRALAALALGLAGVSGVARAGPFGLRGEAAYRLDVPLEPTASAAGTFRLLASGAGSFAPGLSAALTFDTAAAGYFPLALVTWEFRFGTVSAGDFDVRLPGAELVRFNRQLRGIRISLGDDEARAPDGAAPPARLTLWTSRVRYIAWRDRYEARESEDEVPAGVQPVAPGSTELPPLTHSSGVDEPSVAVFRNGVPLRSGLDFQFRAGRIYLATPLEPGERIEVEYRFTPGAALPLQGAMAELQAPGGVFRVYRLGAPAGPPEPAGPVDPDAAGVNAGLTGLSWEVTAGPAHLELEHFGLDGAEAPDAWRWEAGAELPTLSVRHWYERRAPGFPVFDDPEAVLYPQREGLRLSLRPVPEWEVSYESQARYEGESDDFPARERRQRHVRIAYRPAPPLLASVYYQRERSIDPLTEEMLRTTESFGTELRLPAGPVQLSGRAERIDALIPATGSEVRDRWEVAAEKLRGGTVRWSLRHEEEVKQTRASALDATPDGHSARYLESAASVVWTPAGALRVSAEALRIADTEKGYEDLRWSAGAGYPVRRGWDIAGSLQARATAWGGETNIGTTLTLSFGRRGPPLTTELRVEMPLAAREGAVPTLSLTAATPYGSTHQLDLQTSWRANQAPQFTATYRYSPGGIDRVAVQGSVTPVLFLIGEEEARLTVEWSFSPHWSLSAGWQRSPAPVAAADRGVTGAGALGLKEAASAVLHYRF